MSGMYSMARSCTARQAGMLSLSSSWLTLASSHRNGSCRMALGGAEWPDGPRGSWHPRGARGRAQLAWIPTTCPRGDVAFGARLHFATPDPKGNGSWYPGGDCRTHIGLAPLSGAGQPGEGLVHDDNSTPQSSLVRATYHSIEEVGETTRATGWDGEFRQLSKGRITGR